MKKILNKSFIANDKKAYAIMLLTTLLFCSVFIKAATIFSENMLLGTGQNDLVINFATLSNGVYLIQMNIDGKIITEKFLKQ